MISKWIGDVATDTQQLQDEEHGSFTHHPGKSGYFTTDLGGRKIDISH